jgi:hypothetical protein
VPKGGRSVTDSERHACLTGRTTRPHQGRQASRIDERQTPGVDNNECWAYAEGFVDTFAE